MQDIIHGNESEIGTPESLASLILSGFSRYREEFQRVTTEAKERFAGRDWQGVQRASQRRIKLYRGYAAETAAKLQDLLIDGDQDWAAIRQAYVELAQNRNDAEFASTFFNTMYRRTHLDQGIDERVAFVNGCIASPDRTLALCSYQSEGNLGEVLGSVFADLDLGVPFEDLERDLQRIESAMKTLIPILRDESNPVVIERLQPIFYRNKGAYLIGRLTIGGHVFPLAVPILNSKQGAYVDTIIWNENDLSTIFSFTRSYFFVALDSPRAMVNYLNELLPKKKAWELYTSLGFYKHGKTEFYADFLNHLENSDDQFVIAEGIRGMVMTVFTLPSYQTAFKIIKDKFSPTKTVTRQGVMDAYYLVKTHDRVGRMADTQEFTDLYLPRDRFDEQLVAELQRVAANSVDVQENHVVIRHVYSERLMTPLNLYIQDCSEFELKLVLEDYGYAIKQLAAANIFPGDMLLKNFGVTRHGRVVFYDYDEIVYLTDVNFRDIPKSSHPEDGMSAEAWFSVEDADVFPEEFKNFLFSSKYLVDLFSEIHGELFTADYWRSLQANVRDQQLIDVFPYRQNRRFNYQE